jgi:hypothetical protein
VEEAEGQAAFRLFRLRRSSATRLFRLPILPALDIIGFRTHGVFSVPGSVAGTLGGLLRGSRGWWPLRWLLRLARRSIYTGRKKPPSPMSSSQRCLMSIARFPEPEDGLTVGAAWNWRLAWFRCMLTGCASFSFPRKLSWRKAGALVDKFKGHTPVRQWCTKAA